MTENRPAEEDNWFENVENLRPLRGGRRAGTLNEIATGTARVSVEEAERKFLLEFANATDQEDPLESMYRFSTWFEEHFPSGSQKHFYPLLYKICTAFCTEPAYSNDERLLKLWLKLAENFPESGLAVMEFAFAKGSCRQLAKFYIHWSEMYQAMGWWNKAREKLQLGLRMCAMPLDLLHRAIDDMETTAMRVTCEGNSEDEDDELYADSLENTRETLGKLRGLGRRHFAPIVRSTQGPAGVLPSSAATNKHQLKKAGSKKPCGGDKFEIFAEDLATPSQHQKQMSQKGASSMAAATPFRTPIGTRPAKWSRVAESLLNDQDYQTLFGTYDMHAKQNLHITNVENEAKMGSDSLSTAELLHTPAQQPPPFEIFRDDTADKESEGKNLQQQQQKGTKEGGGGGKSRLKLRKEYIRSMSVEEGFAKRVGKPNDDKNVNESIS